MSSVCDLILAAIATALGGIVPAPVSVEIEPAGDPPGGTCLEIYEGDDEPDERECSIIRWSKSVTVTGFVDTDASAAPTEARTALRDAVHRAVMADETLGGLVEQIEPGRVVRHTAVLSSIRRLGFNAEFTITFTTRRSDPAFPY